MRNYRPTEEGERSSQKMLTCALFYSVCIPALFGAGINAYWLWNEHWEHWSHMPPLEERTEYPYQNIRVCSSITTNQVSCAMLRSTDFDVITDQELPMG